MRTTREVAIYLRTVNKMDAGLQSGANSIQQFANDVGAHFRRLAIAVGVAFTALTTFALYSGSEFQQALANTSSMFVASASGANELSSWMGQLEKTARALGETTAFTATEAANAMYSLASGGLDAKEVMEATESVLHLAGATMTDMSSAAELMMSTLRQFNLQASEAGRVANVFAAAIQNSMLTMDRLHYSMQYTGPVAARLGMEIEETAAALAILHNAGLKGSLAGTGMRQVMIRLIRPTNELARVLKGTTVTTHGFAAVIQKLKDAHLRPDQAARMFGQRTLAALSSLLSAGADGFEDMRKKITGTTAAQDAYALQMKTVQSQLTILKSKLNELGLKIWDVMKDDIYNAVLFAQRAVQGAEPYFVRFYKAIRDGVIAALPVMKQFLEGTVNGFIRLYDQLKPVREKFMEILENVWNNKGVVVDFAEALYVVASNASFFAWALGGVIMAFGVLTGNMGLIAISGLIMGIGTDLIKVGEDTDAWAVKTARVVMRLHLIWLDFIGAIPMLAYKIGMLIPWVSAGLLSLGIVFFEFWTRILRGGAKFGEELIKAMLGMGGSMDSAKAAFAEEFSQIGTAAMTAFELTTTPSENFLDKALGLDLLRRKEGMVKTEFNRFVKLYEDFGEASEGALAGLQSWTLTVPNLGKFEAPEWELPDFESYWSGFGDAFDSEKGYVHEAFVGFLDSTEQQFHGLWDTVLDASRTGSQKWEDLWADTLHNIGQMVTHWLVSLAFEEGLSTAWEAWRGRVRDRELQMQAEESAAKIGAAIIHGEVEEYKRQQNKLTHEEKKQQQRENIAGNVVETASEMKTGAAKMFSAYAWLPWVGLALALGSIATMVATMGSFHGGGLIGGSGAQAGDTSEQMFLGQRGEFVMPAAQTKRFLPVLEQMRSGQTPAFSAAGSASGGSGGATMINVNVNVPQGSLLVADDDLAVRRLSEKVANDIDTRLNNRRFTG